MVGFFILVTMIGVNSPSKSSNPFANAAADICRLSKTTELVLNKHSIWPKQQQKIPTQKKVFSFNYKNNTEHEMQCSVDWMYNNAC